MADEKTLTEDDDLELVEVAELPAEDAAAAAPGDKDGKGAKDGKDGEPPAGEGAAAEDEEDDDDDVRLGEDEEGDRSDKERLKRKERNAKRKEARDRTFRELDATKAALAEALQRISAVESHTVAVGVRELESRITTAKADIAKYDSIIAQAVEAGNGVDMIDAMRLRDEARDSVGKLEATKEQAERVRTGGEKPAGDERVATYATQWKQANGWYSQNGSDEPSRITNRIDNDLVRERYDPATPAYWQELTKRVNAELQRTAADRGGGEGGEGGDQGEGRRRGPPVGDTRGSGPPGGKSRVFVTPERKQAMMDAGAWDDPVKRDRMLKAYRDYDAEQRASRH